MMDFERVLVLAPHPDDGELGCGGTLARFAEEGKDVYYAYFSLCEESIPEGFPKDTLATEVREATRVLGIEKSRIISHEYPVRRLSAFRQDILEVLVQLKADIAPDLLLLPCSNDIHQDHVVISCEGMRAFKHTSILGYELPWNQRDSTVTGFVALERRHVQRKIDAVGQYKSQSSKHYARDDFLSGLARVRGVQAGTEFAEAFEVVRWYA